MFFEALMFWLLGLLPEAEITPQRLPVLIGGG